MNRKAPTPIRSVPSSAPLEAMVTKQQSHIDELVMKNRTSEQTIQKLKAEIQAEQHRHESSVQNLKLQFGQERAEWKGAGDSLQQLWRIAYLRILSDLGRERTEMVKMKEELRLARLARLQRNYRIGSFQAKELESEDRIMELREQVEDVEWRLEQERSKRVELKAQLQESVDDLHELQTERNQLEVRWWNIKLGRVLFSTSKCRSEISARDTLSTHNPPCLFQCKFRFVRASKSTDRRLEIQFVRTAGQAD
jgi:chromosome segregation ATPase